MLGAGHFKKKLAKRAQRKAARKAAREDQRTPGAGRGGTPALRVSQTQHQHGAPIDGKARKRATRSTLKGPVVARDDGASRDSGNERAGVTPYTGRGGAARRTSGAKRASGASSAAQRRQVLRRRSDDDLLDHFREKLSGSTFRLLNEQIYNSPTTLVTRLLGDEATFHDYHAGYRQQLVQWPVNPNQFIIDCLLGDRRGRFLTNKEKRLPGHIPQSWVVADMGCGAAEVAAALRPRGYTVHSFDLCALNENVTVANIAHVPLEDGSVDICVFSLSLMATDYELGLFEAFRVLKPRRLLKIVEVRSRIPHPHKFAEMVSDIGFDLDYTDVVGEYFVAFDFVKRDGQAEACRELRHRPGEVLVPSLYKKR